MPDLDALISGLETAVEEGLDAAALDASHVAAAAVTRRSPGDSLADAIHVTKPGAGERVISADKDYAGFVENGRGPVVARPGGPMLHFFLPNGDEVFARSVGPAVPQPFMAPAAAHLGQHGAEHIERAIARLGGS